MVSQVNEHVGVPTKHIVEWTQAFVRHPSPQTERFEHEPQVQSFIGERVVPLVQELGLRWRRDAMGNLLVELGPERADRSLMLMAYAMTHPANRMPNPYAGELIRKALWRRRSRRSRPRPTALPCAAVSSLP
jgi:acetylornithine deacetylase